MPFKHIDTGSADYLKYKPIWEKARDAFEGQEAIHDGKDKYLPKLGGQSTDDYSAYVKRTLFYNATYRTVDAMVGLTFRKDPLVEFPDQLQEFMDDIDLAGTTSNAFAEEIEEDLFLTGRDGVLVDYPNTGTAELTQADIERLGYRPFAQLYKAEDILQVNEKRINNRQVVTMVKLKEKVDEAGASEFDIKKVDQIRILDLSIGPDGSGEPRYRQRLYRKDDKGEWEQYGEDIFVEKNGEAMQYIPFFFVSARRRNNRPKKPPITDLVNANIKHYQVSADYFHGGHFTALPTPVITGHQPQTTNEGGEQEYRIGATTAWILSEPEADAKYLEFTGKGLETLENQLDRLEGQMATLGSRMMAPEKRDVEASETHKIKRQGENSVLSSVASNVSELMEEVMVEALTWYGVEEERARDLVEFSINQDFFPQSISPQMLVALVQAYQSQAMAWSDFVRNLKDGELIEGDRDADEILAEIQTSAPAGMSTNGQQEPEPQPEE